MQTICLDSELELFNIKGFLDNVIKHKDKQNKLLGIDFGTKKLGLSTSDCDFQIAFPYKTLIGNWNNIKNLVSAVCEVIDKANIIGVVIGFPKKLDGTQHKNCITILELVKQLKKKYQNSKYVLLIDERFSTQYVNKHINYYTSNNEHRKTKFKSQYDDDKVATILLNEVLSMINNVL